MTLRISHAPIAIRDVSLNDPSAGAWSFYRFQLADDDYQAVVTLSKDPSGGGYGRMFLRHETLADRAWQGGH